MFKLQGSTINPQSILHLCLGFMLTAIILLCPSDSFAAKPAFPDKPTDNSFVADKISLLPETYISEINAIGRALLTEEHITLSVIIINSLETYDAQSLSIESYTRKLFNDWNLGTQDPKNSILLLISKSDRKAHIELGADLARSHGSDTQYIMNKLIAPRLKKGYFSDGILEGVKAMEAMGRGKALPTRYYPWWIIPFFATITFVILSCIISLLRSGRKGIGWLLLSVIPVFIWVIYQKLYKIFHTHRRSSPDSHDSATTEGVPAEAEPQGLINRFKIYLMVKPTN